MVKQDTQKKGRIPKIFIDLFFTLAIPVAILSTNLLGSGFSFADIVANILANAKNAKVEAFETSGIIISYVIAGLIPAIYIIFDVIKNKIFNPITILAATSALIGGGLAFMQVDGAVFALKDSYTSIVVALVMGGSLIVGRPFFSAFLKLMLEEGKSSIDLSKNILKAPKVQSALKLATFIILFEAAVVGSINFAVNYRVVQSKFGTKDFNNQVAQANTIMRPVSLLSSLAAYALAFFVVQSSIGRSFPGVSLFDEETWKKADKE